MELIHYITLTILLSCYLQNGCSLQCYHCVISGVSSPDMKCNGTVKNCSSDNEYCNIYWVKGSDNLYEFTRDCVPTRVCQPNYCQTYVIDALGKSNCSVHCCQDDLCNHDNIASKRKETVDSSSVQLTIHLWHALQISLMIIIPLKYLH